VVEDLAFEVAEEITTRQVENVIRRIGGDVLAHLELFDIYRGEPLPAGNKSMAYRLTYQHVNRIVAEKEVAALRARIIQAVERETGGKLRG
jgi:phenylalanyl-tRNA synthetase beta chain